MIAISESTRADAIRLLGLKPERIEVIYPGVAELFFGARAHRAAQALHPLRRNHRAPQERRLRFSTPMTAFRLRCGRSSIW